MALYINFYDGKKVIKKNVEQIVGKVLYAVNEKGYEVGSEGYIRVDGASEKGIYAYIIGESFDDEGWDCVNYDLNFYTKKEVKSWVFAKSLEGAIKGFKEIAPSKYLAINVDLIDEEGKTANLDFYIEKNGMTIEVGDKVSGTYKHKEIDFVGVIKKIYDYKIFTEGEARWLFHSYALGEYLLRPVKKIIEEEEYQKIFEAFVQKEKNPLEVYDYKRHIFTIVKVGLEFVVDSSLNGTYVLPIRNVGFSDFYVHGQGFVGKIKEIITTCSYERLELYKFEKTNLNVEICEKEEYLNIKKKYESLRMIPEKLKQFEILKEI